MENPNLTEEVAQAAYAAYGDAVEWKNYQGLPMPRWEKLGDPIRNAWKEAGTAAALRFSRELFRAPGTHESPR